MNVGIVDTGVANTASVRAAFARLDLPTRPVRTPSDLADVSHLVLPGVGAFGVGRARLRERRLDCAVIDWVAGGRPLLAICLGLHLLTEGSDEAPDAPGLGIVPGRCTPLPSTVRIPQLGWNRVRADRTRSVGTGYAAFANSYILADPPPGYAIARSTYGIEFVAALERDRLLACQFHPELSGAWGRALLQRWMDPDAPSPARGSPTADDPSTLARRIIPCLDVTHGRVVKGINFTRLRDAGDPATLAARYADQGGDEIVVLDITATRESRDTHLATVSAVRRAVGIPVTAGGGIRTPDDAARLLEAGADKVSVNSAALANPGLVDALASRFGRQCTVLAIDARRISHGWEALAAGGTTPTGRDAVAWAVEGVDRGAGEILLTSWDRDGTGFGPDTALVSRVAERTSVPVVSSGGIGNADHAIAAFRAGADAVLAASIFHDRRHDVPSMKHSIARAGLSVRR